jgi:N-methylhydantoinase B
VPSSYNAAARDVYHEGAIVFPCVRIQRNRETIEDIVRICRARIRVPDQWYGYFLAGLGAARIGERRLKEFCAKYGRGRCAASSTTGSIIPTSA